MIANTAVQGYFDQVASSRQEMRVAILLSTYNGAAFLKEQLDSLISQTHKNWVIFASDDGSSDATLEILAIYKEKLGEDRMNIVSGPRRGFSANFLSLLKQPLANADFYAFCDQDDVWAANKLELALSWCMTIPSEQPALYCARTQLIDESGAPIGLSPLFSAPASFRNALVQSIAGGNTMVFNRSARHLLMKTREGDHIVSHDWWAYLVVSGCDGAIRYDPTPSVGYRQHGNNLIGSNARLRDRLQRLKRMFHGTFKEWNDSNLHAMQAIHPDLSSENRQTLVLFEQARHSPFLKRLALIIRSGVYRQTPLDNIGLTAAAIFQRL